MKVTLLYYWDPKKYPEKYYNKRFGEYKKMDKNLIKDKKPGAIVKENTYEILKLTKGQAIH